MPDGNRRRDTQYDNIAELLRQRDHELLLQVHTMVPGIIRKYDPRTRRCSVRPALRTVWRDGAVLPRKVLHNVQVLWPRGNNTSIHFDLKRGDPVQILFSERGLEEWRRTHKQATPDATGFFSEKDAVVQAGFGAVAEIEALPGDGVFQSDDAKRRVVIGPDNVVVANEDTTTTIKPDGIDHVSPNGSITYDVTGDVLMNITGGLTVNAGGTINLNAPHVLHGGVEIDSHHTHPYTTPQHAAGQAQSGPPQ